MEEIWVRTYKDGLDVNPLYFIIMKSNIKNVIGKSITDFYGNVDVYEITLGGSKQFQDKKLEAHEIVALKLLGKLNVNL